jgi:hypothetical protein
MSAPQLMEVIMALLWTYLHSSCGSAAAVDSMAPPNHSQQQLLQKSAATWVGTSVLKGARVSV